MIRSDLHGPVDDLLKCRWLSGLLVPEQLMADVMPFNITVAGEHSKGRRIGCQLIIGICKIGIFFVIQGQHLVQLTADFIFDFRVEFIEEGGIACSAFTEDEEDCALNVVALFQT